MPFGGLDWLALTQEPTLEPELPICDPHHHFWDLRTDARALPALSAARAGRRHQQRPQRALDRVHRGARDVPRGRPGGDAPGRRGRVRAGAGRGQRQRAVRPGRAAAADRRARQPEPGRAGRAGAGGVAGGQPEPLPRDPPLGDLGPPPRGGEHGRTPGRGAACQRQFPRGRAGAGADGVLAGGVAATSRSCPSWRSSPGRCPTCRSS